MIYKYSGTKNSFLVIDCRQDATISGSATEAKLFSCGELGFDADGVIWLNAAKYPLDFVWNFFNRDGSSAEMCGNAARCVTLHAWAMQPDKTRWKFQTLAGVIEAKIENLDLSQASFEKAKVSAMIRVTMPQWQILHLDCGSQIQQENKTSFVNTGVPHLVVELNSSRGELLQTEQWLARARQLRHHPFVGPAGSNVNFFIRQPDGIHLITYERGVEAFTASCGTGAVATALVIAHETSQNIADLNLQVPGGNLMVHIEKDSRTAQLIGEAHLDSRIEFY